MGRTRKGAALGLAALLAVVLGGCSPRQPWRSELISANAAGTDAGNAETGGVVTSGSVAFSPDGTKIAFESLASDLGPNDTNGTLDVYLRDLASATTTLVSVNAAGADSGNSASNSPVFSPDGTKLAFSSSSTDLGATDTNGATDLYVRDLTAGTTSLLSVDPGGDAGGSSAAAFSPDGAQLAFVSGEGHDLYLRDLATGTTRLISVNAAGTGGGNGRTWEAAFSPDGTKLAFASEATDLGPVPVTVGPSTSVAYLRDLATETTEVVSINAGATSGLAGWSPTFTSDGRKVVFQSTASGFGPNDTNDAQDVYVRDLVAGTTALVSTNAEGTDSGRSASVDPITSPQGDKVLFTSLADDLAPGSSDVTETDTDTDVYVRDLTTGATELVSVDAGNHADGATRGGSYGPVFSPDGSKVAFVSLVRNFGPDDRRRVTETGYYEPDVYVRDLRKGITTLVSTRADGTTSANGPSREVAAFTPDGTRVGFVSLASDLGARDTNGVFDLYIATLRGADLSLAGHGTPGTYQLDIGNAGPDTAEDPVVYALLPEGTELVEATATAGSCGLADPDHPNIVACHLPALTPGGTAGVTIRVDVTAPPGTTLSLYARVESPTVDPDYTDDEATVTFTAT